MNSIEEVWDKADADERVEFLRSLVKRYKANNFRAVINMFCEEKEGEGG